MAGQLLHAYLIVAGFRGYYAHFSGDTTYYPKRSRILLSPLASFLLPSAPVAGWTVARHGRDAPAGGVCGAAGRGRWATFAANVRQELRRIVACAYGALSHVGGTGNNRGQRQTSRCCRHDKPSSREMRELLARDRLHGVWLLMQPYRQHNRLPSWTHGRRRTSSHGGPCAPTWRLHALSP